MVACTPHPGLGTVAIARPAYVQVVDLATCATSREKPAATARGGPAAKGNLLVSRGKVIVRIRRGDALGVAGTSRDGKWILYFVDAYASASLAADGLPFWMVSAAGGKPVAIGAGLIYDGYRSWCDFRTLVMTVGVSRMAVDNKRLILYHAPLWVGRSLEPQLYRKVFGSLECAPDGSSVVVQETAQSTNGDYHPRWSLWRVSLPSGRQVRLTAPRAGYSDDSPHWSPDQATLYFVRAHDGDGVLYALHGGRLVGPLIGLGHNPGYFGETQWRYAVRR